MGKNRARHSVKSKKGNNKITPSTNPSIIEESAASNPEINKVDTVSTKPSWSWTITIGAFITLAISILWFIATHGYDALLSSLGSFLVIITYFGLRNTKWQKNLDRTVGTLLLIIVSVIGIAIYFWGGNIGLLQANLPLYRAFPPSKDGESLIIVSDFEDRSGGKYPGISASQYVYDNLSDQTKKESANIRIEHLHDLVTDTNVDNVFKIYKPKIIIWGWYDALTVTVYVKASDNPIAPTSLERAQTIIDPEKIQIQITEQIPQKVSFMSFFVLGLERYASADYQKADSYFNQAIALTGYANENELPLLYFYASNTNMVLKNRDLAFEYINLAIKYKPTALMYLSLGNLYYLLDHDLPKAIEQFNTAINTDDGRSIAEIYLDLGSALSDNGDYSSAIENFNIAIKLAKDNQTLVPAYYDRGNAYFREEDLVHAKEDYDYIINNLSTDYAQVYQARALIFSTNGDNASAFKDLNKAISLDPKFRDAYYNRGKLYARTGDLKNALADFETIVTKIDTTDYEVYYLIGRASGQYWIDTNDEHYYEYAMENLNKCIEINKQYTDAYMDRANLYALKLDFQDAVVDYTTVIHLDPRNINAYYFRGLGYKTFGYKSEAIADLQMVLELNPDATMEANAQANLKELQTSP